MRTQEAWTAGTAGWGTRNRGRKPDISLGLSLPALREPAEWAGESLFWAILPPNYQFHLLASPSETILRRNKTTGQVRRLGKAFPISASPQDQPAGTCVFLRRHPGEGGGQGPLGPALGCLCGWEGTASWPVELC